MYSSLALVALLVAAAQACAPTDVQTYSTSDATLATESVLVLEFDAAASCAASLHAEFQGALLPLTQVGERRFQLSHSAPHKSLPAGTYTAQVYDDAGLAAVKKAARAAEETGAEPAAVAPLFTVTIEHKGASKGVPVNTELVASGVVLLVFYLAYSTRCTLTE